MKLTLEDGKFLVSTARKAVELFLEKNKTFKPSGYDEKFNLKRGVFVTLKNSQNDELRGCIGVPLPEKRLIDAVIDSAISSATLDPRFPKVSLEELENLTIEITILTLPELIKVNDPKKYPREIKIGQDGLIIELENNKGLLLPQVSKEWNWSSKEFLIHLCMKAGLPEDSWLNPSVKIYKFQGQIFSETSRIPPSKNGSKRKRNADVSRTAGS